MQKYEFDIYDGLPREYKIVLLKSLMKSHFVFSNNLVNVTLGGSGGKSNIIPNWSDLDLYIVLKKMDMNQIITFMKILSTSPIYVGTTFYSLFEVENNMIDNKTKVMLYEMQNYNVNPILYGNNIYNIIDYNTIKENDINNFPNIMHEFRRRFIKLCNGDKLDKVYIKKLLVLIKCYLSHYDIFSFGYKETFDIFLKVLESKNLTISFSFDIMDVINNIDNSKDIMIKFSKEILEIIENDFVLEGGKKWIKELVRER